MDPLVTLQWLNEPDRTDGERVELAEELAQWIARGGAVPDIVNTSGGTTWTRTPSLTADTLESLRESGVLDLGAALNVALAYGDLSGLEGLGYEVVR